MTILLALVALALYLRWARRPISTSCGCWRCLYRHSGRGVSNRGGGGPLSAAAVSFVEVGSE